jgi:hypothetical protein
MDVNATKVHPITFDSDKALKIPTSRTTFRHTPIDHAQSSFRLVEVAPSLSSDGLIQCQLSHTVIRRAAYVCVSYRWGPAAPCREILINDQLHTVRQNLFEFLEVLRTKTGMLPKLWIDALCIDQQDNLERNHQVAQMGQIFFQAQKVFIWLGQMPSIRGVLQSLKTNWQTGTYDDLNIVRSSNELRTHLYENEYWNRAWVTQEILLARRIDVLLDIETYDFIDLFRSLKSYYLVHDPSFKASPLSPFFTKDYYTVQESDIVFLLHRFRRKHCEIPKDRVYSLLSLCSQRSTIDVNYDASEIHVAQQVLKSCTKPLCLCAVLVVAQNLHLARNYSRHHGLYAHNAPFVEMDYAQNMDEIPRPVGLRLDEQGHWVFPKWGPFIGNVTLEPRIDRSHLFEQGNISWGYKVSEGMFDICPVCPTVVDSLSALASKEKVHRVSLDTHHLCQALSDRGFEISSTAHAKYSGFHTLRISLPLLAHVVTPSISLCPRASFWSQRHNTKDNFFEFESDWHKVQGDIPEGFIEEMESAQETWLQHGYCRLS